MTTIEVPEKPFFYDAHISRVLIQVASKCFAGFKVVSGQQTDGKLRFTRVPLVFKGWSRMVQDILSGGSDNNVIRLPVASFALRSLQRKTSEMRDPKHIQQWVIKTRQRDADGNLMVNEPGELIVVERYMPVSYNMDIELVFWASNYDQLHQLVEQIGSQFNPDQEVQISDSPADWTSPISVIHTGQVQYDEVSRGDKPDSALTASMSFTSTIRMSLPARVYDATLIHEIEVNIREMEDFGYMYFGSNIDLPLYPLLSNLTIIASPQEILDQEGDGI
jgi:hypothetical protein